MASVAMVGIFAIDPNVPSTVYAICQALRINRSLQNGDVISGFPSFTNITGILQTDGVNSSALVIRLVTIEPALFWHCPHLADDGSRRYVDSHSADPRTFSLPNQALEPAFFGP